MLDGQGAANSLDQSRKQHQRIVCWFADHLKLIAGRSSIANLERIQSNTRPEQARPEMKWVGFAVAVHQFDRWEVGVLQTIVAFV